MKKWIQLLFIVVLITPQVYSAMAGHTKAGGDDTTNKGLGQSFAEATLIIGGSGQNKRTLIFSGLSPCYDYDSVAIIAPAVAATGTGTIKYKINGAVPTFINNIADDFTLGEANTLSVDYATPTSHNSAVTSSNILLYDCEDKDGQVITEGFKLTLQVDPIPVVTTAMTFTTPNSGPFYEGVGNHFTSFFAFSDKDEADADASAALVYGIIGAQGWMAIDVANQAMSILPTGITFTGLDESFLLVAYAFDKLGNYASTQESLVITKNTAPNAISLAEADLADKYGLDLTLTLGNIGSYCTDPDTAQSNPTMSCVRTDEEDSGALKVVTASNTLTLVGLTDYHRETFIYCTCTDSADSSLYTDKLIKVPLKDLPPVVNTSSGAIVTTWRMDGRLQIMKFPGYHYCYDPEGEALTFTTTAPTGVTITPDAASLAFHATIATNTDKSIATTHNLLITCVDAAGNQSTDKIAWTLTLKSIPRRSTQTGDYTSGYKKGHAITEIDASGFFEYLDQDDKGDPVYTGSAFPPGIYITPDGKIKGTPLATGDSNAVIVKVYDRHGNSATTSAGDIKFTIAANDFARKTGYDTNFNKVYYIKETDTSDDPMGGVTVASQFENGFNTATAKCYDSDDTEITGGSTPLKYDAGIIKISGTGTAGFHYLYCVATDGVDFLSVWVGFRFNKAPTFGGNMDPPTVDVTTAFRPDRDNEWIFGWGAFKEFDFDDTLTYTLETNPSNAAVLTGRKLTIAAANLPNATIGGTNLTFKVKAADNFGDSVDSGDFNIYVSHTPERTTGEIDFATGVWKQGIEIAEVQIQCVKSATTSATANTLFFDKDVTTDVLIMKATKLPTGISMDTDGKLTGTPVVSGDHDLIVRCLDSFGNRSAAYTKTITIPANVAASLTASLDFTTTNIKSRTKNLTTTAQIAQSDADFLTALTIIGQFTDPEAQAMTQQDCTQYNPYTGVHAALSGAFSMDSDKFKYTADALTVGGFYYFTCVINDLWQDTTQEFAFYLNTPPLVGTADQVDLKTVTDSWHTGAAMKFQYFNHQIKEFDGDYLKYEIEEVKEGANVLSGATLTWLSITETSAILSGTPHADLAGKTIDIKIKVTEWAALDQAGPTFTESQSATSISDMVKIYIAAPVDNDLQDGGNAMAAAVTAGSFREGHAIPEMTLATFMAPTTDNAAASYTDNVCTYYLQQDQSATNPINWLVMSGTGADTKINGTPPKADNTVLYQGLILKCIDSLGQTNSITDVQFSAAANTAPTVDTFALSDTVDLNDVTPIDFTGQFKDTDTAPVADTLKYYLYDGVTGATDPNFTIDETTGIVTPAGLAAPVDHQFVVQAKDNTHSYHIFHYVEVNGPPVWTAPDNWAAHLVVEIARDFSIIIPPTAFVDPNGHDFTISCKQTDDTTACANDTNNPSTDSPLAAGGPCIGAFPCFDPAQNRLYGNFEVGTTSPVVIKLYAKDSLNLESTAVDVSLSFPNNAAVVPNAIPSPAALNEFEIEIKSGATWTYNLPIEYFTDPDPVPYNAELDKIGLLYKFVGQPAWLVHAGAGAFDASRTLTAGTAIADGTVADAGETGYFPITITADDQRGSADQVVTMKLIVNDKPDCDSTKFTPDLAAGAVDNKPQSGHDYTYTMPTDAFKDHDVGTAAPQTDVLTFTLVDTSPTWLSIDSTNGNLSGIPIHARTETVTVRVSDGLEYCDLVQDITVTENNKPTQKLELVHQFDLKVGDTIADFVIPIATHFEDIDVDAATTPHLAVDTIHFEAFIAHATRPNSASPYTRALPDFMDTFVQDATNLTLSKSRAGTTYVDGDRGTYYVTVEMRDKPNGSNIYWDFTSALLIINVEFGPAEVTAVTDQDGTTGKPKAKRYKPYSFVLPDNMFEDKQCWVAPANAVTTLTYSATADAVDITDPAGAIPDWLEFVTATRTLQGTPPDTDTVAVVVSVKDRIPLSATGTSFNIEVEDNFCPRHLSANAVPDFTDANTYTGVKPGTFFDYQFPANLFEEPDSDTMTYSACRYIDDNACDPLPVIWGTQNLQFDAADRRFTGIPQDGVDSGTIQIKISVIDPFATCVKENGGDGEQFQIFKIQVDTTPTLVVANKPTDQTAREGIAFTYALPTGIFVDADAGQTLTQTVTQKGGAALPAWLSFSAGSFSGTPTPGSANVYSIAIKETDNYGAYAETDFTITVGYNSVPYILENPEDVMLSVGETKDVIFNANNYIDADGDALTVTWTLANGEALPNWMQKSGDTTLNIVAPDGSQGSYDIKVTIKDIANAEHSVEFKITVNAKPVIVKLPEEQQAIIGQKFEYVIPADTISDPDNDYLTCTATRRNGEATPTWLTYSSFTNTFSAETVPTSEELGGDEIIDLKVVCSDEYGQSVDFLIFISVLAEESITNAQVMAAAVSVAVILVGGPLTALLIVKISQAKSAIGAVRASYQAVGGARSAVAATSNAPVQNWSGGQPNPAPETNANNI